MKLLIAQETLREMITKRAQKIFFVAEEKLTHDLAFEYSHRYQSNLFQIQNGINLIEVGQMYYLKSLEKIKTTGLVAQVEQQLFIKIVIYGVRMITVQVEV
ncbi:Hypothetical_protein [Hexamita inflata]|uniref:Hypothetical_protein n=1 Tax=Hexamita inflata TaxID=28002 RepID=A0AA86R1T1_9EUKA|nr:Hypothetical protein HINF_LOCUS55423 [Hexamita inflata]